jgi:dipeptidyl aminopeptidase/acylaminoacyl peptidase
MQGTLSGSPIVQARALQCVIVMSRTLWLLAALSAAPLVATLQPPPAAPTPAPPDTEIFLASLSSRGQPVVGRASNITSSPGYDNQPSFTPDGAAIFFTSSRGTTQTDIYRYEIASGATTRITNTPEGEYSPTVTPDGAHISVIRVEADGTQRLWRFTLDGREPALVLERVKPVGYHAWADDHMLALFVLGSPATLQLADTRSGNAETVARGINRSLQRIPHTGTISFVDKDANGSLMVRELDPKTRNVTTLVAAVAGAKEADLAWTPDGLLMMAEKDILYSWRRNDVAWTRVADLGAVGMHGVTRIAVSPKGDRIAFVGAP